ncbi:MAG TPA: type II toxin-antitoxin system VapB family antitoxin [Terriglobia bacterium]|nr:type II toxin-antitoxin system VapB family antitoxin [Terriglobia bacterium]
MAITIKNAEADKLAREIANQTGETLTGAVVQALRERRERLVGRGRSRGLARQLDKIAKRCAALPIIDARSEDEILGYDGKGLPRLP